MEYNEFLKSKVITAPVSGFDVRDEDIHQALMPHQRDAVRWALHGGRRALFEKFGLGKSVQQLEFCRQVMMHEGGKALIVVPLGVRQEFVHDAVTILGMEPPQYITHQVDADEAPDGSILLTNYERVRDGDIDPKKFTAVSLDEAAVLRNFGSKTSQVFIAKFHGIKYKLVATATPSPNRFKELVHYSGFLEVASSTSIFQRFFHRNSTKAHEPTLFEHKKEEFWLWVSSWALYISTPSDLGYDSTGYDLPPLEVRTHVVKDDYGQVTDRDGQFKLMNDAAASLSEAAREKNSSIAARVSKAKEIVDSDPDAHFLLWHDLEAERHALKKAIPGVVDIYGSMDYDERERRVIAFSEGDIRLFATKKSLSGCGCNFQRHCHRAIFVGIDYQFHDLLQAIHRVYRYLQDEKVIIDIIYMEAEQPIYDELMEKWKRHDEMEKRMTEIVKKYGLNQRDAIGRMERSIGVKRVEERGRKWKAINNDCVEEVKTMPDNSVDLIHTSIPFSNQFEYTPSYNDFGHNENTERFFEQMDYLSPELLRILKPGRVFACHVKDRTLYGNVTGLGMTTVEPFHAMCISHYMKHGFQYFGMITVVTDVVRENNQTYRLTYTEQCKDGTKMGVGMPEYVLLFRKLPSDTSKAYADDRVVKDKEDYSLVRWQLDAHAFWRSSGNRYMTGKELSRCSQGSIQRQFKDFCNHHIYDYEAHVKLGEDMTEENPKSISKTFMTLPPSAGGSADVWDDITRIKTLNTSQSRRSMVMHVCFATGTLVLTKRGYVPIETIEVCKDEVLTNSGEWHVVVAKKKTQENAKVIQTVAQGVPLLISTPEHKVMAKRSYGKHPKDNLVRVTEDWVEAQNLNDCYVKSVMPPEMESNISAQEWWIIGRWLADGHIDARGSQYLVSVGSEKFEEFVCSARGNIGAVRDKGSCKQIGLVNLSKQARNVLKKCGKGAKNKVLPAECISLNETLSYWLLRGYLSGDGHLMADGKITASSVSRPLLLGMAIVAQKVYGRVASVYAGRPERESCIEGRKVHCNQEWNMVISPNFSVSAIGENQIAWKKVKEIKDRGTSDVWSIEVDSDHSYMAEGCVVKNCPLQIDIVERIIRRYSNENDLVFDPFGGIGTVPLTAIKMGRRGLMTELNPGYFHDAVNYLKDEEDDTMYNYSLFDMMETPE